MSADPRTLIGPAAAFVVVAVLATACGDGDSASTSSAPSTATIQTTTSSAPAEAATTSPPATEAAAGVTFVGADGVETVVTDTSRIVPLAGDLTEIVFALGLGDQVVGIDVTTTYPAEALETPVVGFGQQLAPEAVLSTQPTVVLADQLTGPPEAITQLREAGIPVLVFESATTLDGVVTKIGQVAEVLGAEQAGDELAASVQAEIDEATAQAAGAEVSPRVAFVYVRGPETLLLFGAGMPTQAMIEAAGGTDVAAESGVQGAVPLTPEALAAAAPEVIVLPEAGLAALGGPEAFAAIPGVADTPAGQTGTFLAYDEGALLGMGPRTGQVLAELVADLHPELE